jgi:site-specific recombinase XerD
MPKHQAQQKLIKACFEYATDEDLIEKSPARKLVMPNIRKKSCESFLSADELRALLPQASPREHLVLRILAVCGLRPNSRPSRSTSGDRNMDCGASRSQ